MKGKYQLWLLSSMAVLALHLCFSSLAFAEVAPAPASAPVANTDPSKGLVILSNPGYKSYWAFVEEATAVYKYPSGKSRKITRLGRFTPDKTNELVALLAEREDANGILWVKVRLPILPNNSTGWVPGSKLGEYHRVNTHLIVDRKSFRATLIKNGKAIFTTPVGVGRSYWPTPRGHFYVRARLRGMGGIYGPLAFGTSARSNVLTDWPGGGFIGIHGTNQPSLLPGRVSHGCVRMRNDRILRLGELMSVGTPITIR